MNSTSKPQAPSRLAQIIGGIVAALFVAFLIYAGLMPNYLGHRTGKMNRIFNNLRQLDAAVQEWAIEHHQTGDVVVTRENLAPYLIHQSNNGWMKSVDGELYVLKTLSQPPEAILTRDLETRLKGTVFRFGTNGDLQIILPGDAGTNGSLPHR